MVGRLVLLLLGRERDEAGAATAPAGLETERLLTGSTSTVITGSTPEDSGVTMDTTPTGTAGTMGRRRAVVDWWSGLQQ